MLVFTSVSDPTCLAHSGLILIAMRNIPSMTSDYKKMISVVIILIVVSHTSAEVVISNVSSKLVSGLWIAPAVSLGK